MRICTLLRARSSFFAHSLVLILFFTFYRKSPVFHQKSPTFHPKSPAFHQKSPPFHHLHIRSSWFFCLHICSISLFFLFLISHRLRECPNLGLLPLYIGCFAKKYSVHKLECSFFFLLPRVYMEANKPIQKMLGTYEEPIKGRRWKSPKQTVMCHELMMLWVLNYISPSLSYEWERAPVKDGRAGLEIFQVGDVCVQYNVWVRKYIALSHELRMDERDSRFSKLEMFVYNATCESRSI